MQHVVVFVQVPTLVHSLKQTKNVRYELLDDNIRPNTKLIALHVWFRVVPIFPIVKIPLVVGVDANINLQFRLVSLKPI